jgi:hypothetical protein
MFSAQLIVFMALNKKNNTPRWESMSYENLATEQEAALAIGFI